jgi:isocitrate dehydrogenase
MSTNVPITVAHGDGIGPEIMEGSLIYKESVNMRKVGTKEFAQAVVARLGKTPHTLKAADSSSPPPKARKEKAGAEVSPETQKVAAAQKANGEGLELTMIDDRGVKMWPDGITETLDGGATSKKTVALLGRVLEQGLEIVKTETHRTYDSSAGYTLSQGQ